ncbi:hypothetical protein [Sphingomonas montana]|uniref:hypothetical protein n=1 Tax=Sphingomonas montana TaxID=1843236 RepID=UPI00096CA26A|nr:hypothetical protein [Sphingomonas montana]
MKSHRFAIHSLGISLALALSTPAFAGNSLVPGGAPVAVAKSTLTVTPATEWNRLGARPGRNAETWTLDGDTLNDLTFYGGIADGQPIVREVSKKARPLPRFSGTMLLNDLPALFEQTYRVALDTPLMEIGRVEPTRFAGRPGVRFGYRFTRPDENVERMGEGYAAIVDGKLYMATFEAPAIHYFASGIDAARAVATSAVLP